MDKIGLGEVIDALHSELAAAAKKVQGQGIRFPVGSAQLEFQVGVTWDETVEGGVKFWVLNLDASGNHSNESVHKVTINLEAPVDNKGRRLNVADDEE